MARGPLNLGFKYRYARAAAAGMAVAALLPMLGFGAFLWHTRALQTGVLDLSRLLPHLSHALLYAVVPAVVAIAAAAWLGWRAGERIERPLAQLLGDASRFGHGDYTQPVAQGGVLGDLQLALENMRSRLRSSTVSRDYLNSVLDGMADAVFVTSPQGVIKIANRIACELLGCPSGELEGRGIIELIDERERSSFDPQSPPQPREILFTAAGGGAIPVALTGARLESDDPQCRGNIFVARNLTEQKRTERRIRYLARYDTLTRVPNRMQFQHVLQQAIARGLRAGQALALLYLDLDRFKELNDTLGHVAGDRALEVLSERLTRLLPRGVVIGRIAGDEFALFVEGLPGDADNRGPVAHLARTVLAEVGRGFKLNQQEFFLSASIGIALCPLHAENVIDLIRNADAAMYHSKQNGGNTFAFYSPEMNAAAVERLMLKSKLRRALERGELVIHYQPKVDLRDGRVIGAEALLRWRPPGHGDIPPSQFIPLAEETGLILQIGEWVLDRVCRDYKQLRSEVTDPGRISMNLSLRQLREASFILHCRSVFQQHGVSPALFELEITETTLMSDKDRTLKLLDELHAMGLHLSIDDFGTGYSSLSALQQFPIGTLKIDQSFVRDVAEDAGDATIVRTIIDMGRTLGMDVVAEGIESLRHLRYLRDHGCPFGQGRLFGDPAPIGSLLALLARQANGAPPFAHLLPASGRSVGAPVISAPARGRA
ncbi:MAG TPA: EAL domain-containing protein [Steroidobacteraceae bacterium]|nr:EAL domain-containing protein [Steroidobacteraceae bacterium]